MASNIDTQIQLTLEVFGSFVRSVFKILKASEALPLLVSLQNLFYRLQTSEAGDRQRRDAPRAGCWTGPGLMPRAHAVLWLGHGRCLYAA